MCFVLCSNESSRTMIRILLPLVALIRPSVCCLQGCDCQGSSIQCVGYNLNGDLEEWLSRRSGFKEIVISDTNLFIWNLTEKAVQLLRQIERLSLVNCKIEKVVVSTRNVSANLRFLSLSKNFLTSFPVAVISSAFPSLAHLDLSENQLRHSDDQEVSFAPFKLLKVLNLSHNSLSSIPKIPIGLSSLILSSNAGLSDLSFSWTDDRRRQYYLKTLDLRGNFFAEIFHDTFQAFSDLETLILSECSIEKLEDSAFNGLRKLKQLDLAINSLTKLNPVHFTHTPLLTTLNISNNPLKRLPVFISLPLLKEIVADGTDLDFVLLNSFQRLLALTRLSLSNCPNLVGIFGTLSIQVPSLRYLYLRNSSLSALPRTLFRDAKLTLVDLSLNSFVCDCRALWMTELVPSIASSIVLNSTVEGCQVFNGSGTLTAQSVSQQLNLQDCTSARIVGQKNGQIVLGLFGRKTRLMCGAFGIPEPKILWSRVELPQELFAWDPKMFRSTALYSKEYADQNGFTDGGGDNRVQLLPGGVLEITTSKRADIGVYRCTAWNTHGNSSLFLRFRLDYSEWSTIKIYCGICGVLTVIAFFILNGLYASVRQCVLAKLSRMERSSKVKMMLEAMEKYRQRQVEALHQKYTNRVQVIRDNCTLQMDQLRKGYAQQTERFRSYKEAQFEHIGSVYDNYTTQVSRVREYGHRQMERLYENYQQQLNRIRAFSLQQRLRLMRQYQIQQKYLDKVLKGLNFYESEQYQSGVNDAGAMFADGGINLSSLLSADGDLGDMDPNQDPDVPSGSGSQRPLIYNQDDDAASLLTYHSLPDDDADYSCWSSTGPTDLIESQPSPAAKCRATSTSNNNFRDQRISSGTECSSRSLLLDARASLQVPEFDEITPISLHTHPTVCDNNSCNSSSLPSTSTNVEYV